MPDTRVSHLAVERLTPQYWRVSFDHGPINTITADTVAELSRLVDEIERDADLTVVVFISRNPQWPKAWPPHWTASTPTRPSGLD